MKAWRTIAITVTLVALGLGAGLTTGAAAQLAGAAGSPAFTDPTADSNGAPDITSVVISDDASTGGITVGVTTGSWPDDGELVVGLDADRKASTGDGGIDYLLSYSRLYWDMEKWDGGAWKQMPLSPSMGFAQSGPMVMWHFSKADIGGSTGFRFMVVGLAYDADGEVTGRDAAPDAGFWLYDLSASSTSATTASLRPFLGTPLVSPTKAVAGRQFTVTFPVMRGDGKPLATGAMICDPSVNGKVIPHSEHFANGKATLSFVIPKSAKGKTLRVKVTIKNSAASATRIANYRVS